MSDDSPTGKEVDWANVGAEPINNEVNWRNRNLPPIITKSRLIGLKPCKIDPGDRAILWATHMKRFHAKRLVVYGDHENATCEFSIGGDLLNPTPEFSHIPINRFAEDRGGIKFRLFLPGEILTLTISNHGRSAIFGAYLEGFELA